MLLLTGQTSGLVVLGTKGGLDAGIEWCKSALTEILGPDDGAAALHFLPALQGLIFFKSQDRHGLEQWARTWKDSLM